MRLLVSVTLLPLLLSSGVAFSAEPASGSFRTTVGSYTIGLSLFEYSLTTHEAPWLRVVVINNSGDTVPKPIVSLNGPVLRWRLVDEAGNDVPCAVMEGTYARAFDGEVHPGDSAVEYHQFGWNSWHVSLVYGRYAILINLNARALSDEATPGKPMEFLIPFEVRACDDSEDVGMELLEVADSLMRDKKRAEYADTSLQMMRRYPGSLAARIAFAYAYYVARQHPDLVEVDWRDMAREFVIENCESPVSIRPARNLSRDLGRAYVDSLIEASVKPKAAYSPLYEVRLHYDE